MPESHREQTGHRPPGPPVITTANPMRRLLHALFALAGWMGFGFYLGTVFLKPLDATALPTFFLLLAFGVTIVAVNRSWVAFNMHQSRRLPKRRQARVLEFTADHDQLGRRLVGHDWKALREAVCIEIDLDVASGEKRYRVGGQRTGVDPAMKARPSLSTESWSG